MKIILLGAPGSGKGTQAKLLAQKLSVPHISTGDIFRQNIADQTELGKKVKKILDAGALVPDAVTDSLIKSRLAEADCAKGYILDGYPRNLHQAEYLDSISKIGKAVNVQVDDAEVTKRMSGRRSCPSCGKVYHLESNPSSKGEYCECGTKLVQRNDDKPQVVTERLRLYHELTEPIIDYYQKKGIILEINGGQAIELVLAEILLKLGITTPKTTKRKIGSKPTGAGTKSRKSK